MEHPQLPLSVHVVVKSISESMVILETPEKSEIRWPKDKLPADTTVGTLFQIAVVDDALASQEREKMAKQILNEILKTKE